jgi:hypothetical protein
LRSTLPTLCRCIVRGGTGTNGGILEAGAQLSADGTILAVPCYSGTAGTNVANSAARYVYTLDSTGAATLTSMSLNGRTLYSALAYSSTVWIGGLRITEVSSCNDALKNADETDVDCGGNCGSTCDGNEVCRTNADCLSLICQKTVETDEFGACSK